MPADRDNRGRFLVGKRGNRNARGRGAGRAPPGGRGAGLPRAVAPERFGPSLPRRLTGECWTG
jgi:hypothetical protein